MKKQFFLIMVVFCTLSATAQQIVSKPFLLGKANYATDTSFVKVPATYTNKPTYLKRTAYNAYLKMRAAAAKKGFKLDIVSGTRSFSDQNRIWNRKWDSITRVKPKLSEKDKVLDILQWSSMPGTSRHHWGTDMDLVSISPAYFNTPKGKDLYTWLVANAPGFGFNQPFTAGRATGYNEEKWHWSFLPLSKTYIAEYKAQVHYADLEDIRGSTVAPQIGIIQNWVLAVNPQCK